MKYLITILSILTIFQYSIGQKTDEPIITKSIFFGGGSYYIDTNQAEELKELIESIENLELYEVYIHGHTDDIGSLEYNQWLSEMRTDEVIQKVIHNGFDHGVVFEKDFGELSPVYDNSTWEGKLKNRRVDIIFKKLEM